MIYHSTAFFINSDLFFCNRLVNDRWLSLS
jgi:hypothetical protein